MKRTLLSLLACIAALSLASAARADDWAQFRHDSSHTATSKDKLQFPLKEAWSWDKRGLSGHSPLYHAVIWQDKVYFTGSDGKQRRIICADARTDAVKWQKPLASEKLPFAISDIAGPAVTDNGVVFVYDWIRLTARNDDERQQIAAIAAGLGSK